MRSPTVVRFPSRSATWTRTDWLATIFEVSVTERVALFLLRLRVALLSWFGEAEKLVDVVLAPYVVRPEVAAASSNVSAKVPPLPGCGSSGAPCWSPQASSAELVRPSSPNG